jgi:hypothetical protein
VLAELVSQSITERPKRRRAASAWLPALAAKELMEVVTIELAVESVRQGSFELADQAFQPVRTNARRAGEHT